ncbi:MAG: hypothetical protein ACQKBW_00925 [Puniceicoccales bacterium]
MERRCVLAKRVLLECLSLKKTNNLSIKKEVLNVFKGIIADDQTRKNVYFEIYYNDIHLADVIHENGFNELVIYNNSEKAWSTVPLAEFIEYLEMANKDMVFKGDCDAP